MARRMAVILPAVVALIQFAACATSGSNKTVLLSAPPKAFPCDLELYTSADEVRRPYEKLCVIDARGESLFDDRSDASGRALEQARRDACGCGAEAIIIQGSYRDEDNILRIKFRDRQKATVYGVAIRYTAAAQHEEARPAAAVAPAPPSSFPWRPWTAEPSRGTLGGSGILLTADDGRSILSYACIATETGKRLSAALSVSRPVQRDQDQFADVEIRIEPGPDTTLAQTVFVSADGKTLQTLDGDAPTWEKYLKIADRFTIVVRFADGHGGVLVFSPGGFAEAVRPVRMACGLTP